MTNPESIDPQLFGVDEITQDMALEITKITRNPNALLMQTRHEDKYALAKNMRAFFKDEIEIDSWEALSTFLKFRLRMSIKLTL